MAFSSYRGTVGLIRPTMRPGVFEDLVRMMPEGICFIPLFNDVRRGNVDEFKSAPALYRAKAEEVAKQDIDLIFLSGAPPWMLLGPKGEQKLMRDWSRDLGVPVVTSAVNQLEAFKALKVKRIYGVTYFPGKINKLFADYFDAAGYETLAMDGTEGVDFTRVQELSSHVVYAKIKQGVKKHPKAEAIYMLGPAWRTLDIIEPLEQDLGLPVVHATPAQCWYIQKLLGVRQPRSGYGRLLADMP